MGFVIRYDSKKRPGYYRGNGTIMPALGAKLEETPKYATREIAQTILNKFPYVAAVMSEVITEEEAQEIDKKLAETASRRKR